MRLVWSSVLLAVLGSGAVAAPQIDGPSTTLTMPDGTVLQLAPGERSFDPDGSGDLPALLPPIPVPVHPRRREVETPPAPPTPPLSAAQRRKQALDDLYGRLAQAKDPIEAKAIGDRITEALLHSGSDTADLLMERAVTAMDAKDYTTAEAVLDKLVVLRPRWAEAWNKRATVRYLDDDDVGAMGDIGEVLALEPRHVGALSGMGLILHRNGDDKGALTVLRKAQAIDPQDAGVKVMIDQLGPDVEGHAL